MAIPDKIGAANKINELLSGIVKHGGLRLKYRITVDPPMAEERDWERPEILVEFSGPDSPLLLGRGQRARKGLLRLHESSLDAFGRIAHRRKRGCGESSQERSAVPVCSHVIEGAAHCASCAARSHRSAYGKPGRWTATVCSGVSKGLQVDSRQTCTEDHPVVSRAA